MTAMACPSERLDVSSLDAESQAWWHRLHGCESVRTDAIEELHERLQREAKFHVRQRVSTLAAFPRSDIDDLATQAADDALIALLGKLDDYRGESQFLTWARRFAALDAQVSVRRRLGRDRIGISRDPEHALLVAVAIDGVSTDTLAGELQTTPGAIYKTLHDARVKVRKHAA